MSQSITFWNRFILSSCLFKESLAREKTADLEAFSSFFFFLAEVAAALLAADSREFSSSSTFSSSSSGSSGSCQHQHLLTFQQRECTSSNPGSVVDLDPYRIRIASGFNGVPGSVSVSGFNPDLMGSLNPYSDPDWIRTQRGPWIRIRKRIESGFNAVPGSVSGLNPDSMGSLDPYPDSIRIQWGPWIRIRIRIESVFNGVPWSVSGSGFVITDPDPGGQKR